MSMRRRLMGLAAGVAAVAGQMLAAPAHTVLLEAEGFADPGGWALDTQVMDQMGSPFLMAHGLGRPVRDAVTPVRFPAAGTYRVWVRTRDWAAPWNAPEAPGRFQVLIHGEPLPVEFGTQGAEWHWQAGGIIDIPEDGRDTTVALRDLTGFNGRCDAIVFTTDADARHGRRGGRHGGGGLQAPRGGSARGLHRSSGGAEGAHAARGRSAGAGALDALSAARAAAALAPAARNPV